MQCTFLPKVFRFSCKSRLKFYFLNLSNQIFGYRSSTSCLSEAAMSDALKWAQEMMKRKGAEVADAAALLSASVAEENKDNRHKIEIPLEIVAQSREEAARHDAWNGSSLASGNGPELVTCPYDANHRVNRLRMHGHLSRCRTQYEQACLCKGEEVVKLSCKYNNKHQVHAPELLYHEEQDCDERFKTYVEAPCYLRGELKKPTQAELDQMYEGYFVDKFIGGDNITNIPIPFEDLRRPEQLKKEVEKKMKIKNAEEAQKKDVEKKKGTVGSKGDADDDYWAPNPNHPRFDYMENLLNPREPTNKLPSGLVKSQRKDFEMWNRQRKEELEKAEKEQIELLPHAD